MKKVDSENARQGVIRGWPVRVLVISTLAVIAVFAIIAIS